MTNKAASVASEIFKALPTFYRDVKDWWEEVEIDPEQVIEQLAEQPALYSFYAAMYAEMKRELAERKEALKVLEAQVEDEYREAKSRGAKKTENEIKAEVLQDSRTTARRRTVREVQHRLNLLEVIVDSMKMRHDSLRSIGARIRVEAENIHGPTPSPPSNVSFKSLGKPRRGEKE